MIPQGEVLQPLPGPATASRPCTPSRLGARAAQVVIGLLESNVDRGSRVYERGHILILANGRTRRDLIAVRRGLRV